MPSKRGSHKAEHGCKKASPAGKDKGKTSVRHSAGIPVKGSCTSWQAKASCPYSGENGAGVIYGVTYIDHNIRAVFKGSALGKEFSASVINRKYGTLPSVPDRPAPGQEPPVNTDTRETGLAEGLLDIFSMESCPYPAEDIPRNIYGKKKKEEGAERPADQLTKYSHITTNHIPYGTRRFQRTRQDHRLHAGG